MYYCFWFSTCNRKPPVDIEGLINGLWKKRKDIVEDCWNYRAEKACKQENNHKLESTFTSFLQEQFVALDHKFYTSMFLKKDDLLEYH